MTIQYQGVWTLSAAAQLQSTQRWVTDPLYKNTTLLLQADDAANGAQNNTFLDSSSNSFAITRNGNTTQGSFTPFSLQPGAWSNYFNGSSDYLRIADNAAFDFGTGAFCIEMWFMLTADAAQNGETNREATLLGAFPDSGTLANTYAIGIGGNSATTGTAIAFSIRQGDTIAYNQVYTAPITKNEWHHVVVCRSGNNFAMFYDGLRVSSNASYTYSVDTAHSVKIGALIYPTYNHYFPGYISNVRIVKGASVYTPTNTSIVVPNIPLGATSGGQTPPTGTQTSLLTCQSNRFVDNGGLVTPNTITIGGGTPSVQAFSPFAPQFQWTPSVIGGSGYFDGSGDWLSFSSNAAFTVGTGSLTIEAWIYVTSLSQTFQGIISGRADASPNFPGLGLVIDNSQLFFTILNIGTGLRDSANVPLNQWVHVVGVRSGTNAALFVNGARKAFSASNSDNGTSSDMVIGRYYPATNNYYFSGYIAGARLLKGTAAYDPTQTTITIPTAPATPVANTSFLTNFTNAGIYDGTMKNNLETVGNAQVSTAVVKYGSGSMYFDGTGDYLYLPSNRNLELGTGDFTLECWVYATSAPSDVGIFESRTDGNGATTNGFTITAFSSSVIRIFSGSVLISSSGTSYVNTWCHVAVTRVSGTFNLYINGVSQGTSTTARTLSNTDAVVGGGRYGTTGAVTTSFPGYIDDLRITKGIARYTQNFIPPSVALPRQ